MPAIEPFLQFARSKFGLAAMAFAVILLGVSFFRGCGNDDRNPLPPRTNSTELTQQKFHPGSIPAPKPAPVKGPLTNPPTRSVILTIDAHLPDPTNAVPEVFAPAGSKLVCVLINTVESIGLESQITGRVVRDLWFAKKLVVPAGTKVFAKARVDRVRDRIGAEGLWTLVFPSGEELIIQGIAQCREELVAGEKWGRDDGSSGLKGQVIKNATGDEIKLFAAAFLSGISQGLQQTENTVFGSQVRRSIKNAALAGSGAVLDEYARSIAEAIKRDGVFVRVPGGTEFTVFLPTTLVRSAARVGATYRASPKP